jgi:hypothetical protein
MTLLSIDGFAHANPARYAAGVPGSYTQTATPRVPGSYYCTGAVTNSIRKTISASSEVFSGIGFRVATLAASKTLLTMYGDSATTQHISIVLNAAGHLEARRGNATGALLTTGVATLAAGVWYYLEVRVTVSDTVGVVQCRLNGSTSPDVNYSGDTRNGGTLLTVDAVAFSGGGGGAVTDYFCDWYIANTAGSLNNTWLGDVVVRTVVPTADGVHSQLMGSDSDQVNNWALVDELPPSATDYTGGSTVGLKDSYALADLPASVVTVCGVQVFAAMLKADAGLGSAKILTRSGSTDYTPNTYSLSTTPTEFTELMEVDPATAVAWTPAGVNALEVGMEVA